MWEVLGIARTTDKTVIRRAYAAKLRTIDSDRDPAAFIQIRQAYEAALAWSNRPKPRLTAAVERAKAAEEGKPPELLPAPPPVVSKPPLSPPGPDEEDAAAVVDFEKAIGEKRTLDAARTLDRLIARGLIGLGLGTTPMFRLAELALTDFSLSAEAFSALVGKLGYADVPPHRDDAAELRRRIGYRLAADAWLRSLHTTAANRPWGKVHDDVLVARVFVGRRGLWRLPGVKTGRMLRFIEEYRRHQPWLSEPLDAARVERIEARYRRLHRRWRRREKVYTALAFAVVIFLLVDFIWVVVTGGIKQ